MEQDRILIEQSIAKQYGILPSRQGDLAYSDWAKLVGGLMADTPLGQAVRIRSEQDPEVLRSFTPSQRRMRAQWRAFMAQRTPEAAQERQAGHFERMFAAMFGGNQDG